MARDTEREQRESNPRQSAGASQTAPDATSEKANKSSAGTDRGDRERTIQSDREGNAPFGVARRQTAGSVSGAVSPFTLMRRMTEDMDRLFENFGFGRAGLGLAPFLSTTSNSRLWQDTPALEQAVWSPQVETFRRGDKLIVRADLPGLKKEDVKVEVDDGVLVLSGERSDEHEDNRDGFYRSERSYGQFYRAVPLPDDVDGEQCDATFKDGVLEVTLAAPKKQERSPKQVQIR
jgi:HSP20 family protein